MMQRISLDVILDDAIRRLENRNISGYNYSMARPPRLEFPGAFYHVIVRGNHRQDIFLDEQDRLEYLSRVSHYKGKTGFILYAYVLMSNHVHLLIETPKSPVSKIMQLINFTYTRYFNRRYGKVGHLFQGRYKAILCDRDEYLLGLVRYIHLNPVRANIVSLPHEYLWSSHSEYLGLGKGLAETNRVLRLFSESVLLARRLYKGFIDEAVGAGRDDSYYTTMDQQILGDEKFADEVGEKLAEPEKHRRKPSFQRVFKVVEEMTGISREAIISRSRKSEVVFARGLLVSVCREVGYKLVDLTDVLKRESSSVSKLARMSDSDKGRNAVNQSVKLLNSRIQA
ncbi:MAG: transposase [Nitrospirae bacterium]|nr:transposase [Nitrospirota bacterium]